MIDTGLIGTAEFDPTGRYRYSLTRTWGGKPFAQTDNTIAWIMLNPSTADADVLDPTIRRCVMFSRRWGFKGLEVVNVFGIRATDPKQLSVYTKDGVDIVGPGNHQAIRRAIRRNAQVVAAWGGNANVHRSEVEHIVRYAIALGVTLHALRITAGGHPGHPLYIRYGAKRTPINLQEVIESCGTPRK